MKNVSWIKVKNIVKMYDAEQGRKTYLTLLLTVIAMMIMYYLLTSNDYIDDPVFIQFEWDNNVNRLFSYFYMTLLPTIMMLFMEKFFYKSKLVNKLTLPATILEKYVGLALIFLKYNITAVISYIILAVIWLVYIGINDFHFTAYYALSDITTKYLPSWLITQIFVCIMFFYAFVSQKTEVLRRAVAIVVECVVIIVYFLLISIILPKGEPLTIVSQTLYVLIFSVILLIQGYHNLKHSNYEE